MMRTLLALVLLALGGTAAAQTCDVTATWAPPMIAADGSQMTGVVGYRLQWGTQVGTFTGAALVVAPTMTTKLKLPAGPHYFGVVAFDATRTGRLSNVQRLDVCNETTGANIAWPAPPPPVAPPTTPPVLSSIREGQADWTCEAANGTVLSSHARQDTALVACGNRALQAPGTVFYLRPARYRVVAQ